MAFGDMVLAVGDSSRADMIAATCLQTESKTSRSITRPDSPAFPSIWKWLREKPWR